MKLLHQVWYKYNWNLDSYFQDNIWDGFILNAYSIEENKIWKKISNYEFNSISDKSFLDLQYYWWNSSKWWKLDTYSFHPIHLSKDDTMTLSWIELIYKWIDYQIDKNFKNIIIPHTYYDITDTKKILDIIKAVNKKLKDDKKNGFKYYMTLPISNEILYNNELLEELLITITDISISFDGYYIACESKPWIRKKVNDSFVYYNSLNKIFKTLKQQEFSIIYAYANFDAIIFYSLVDIDYISLWTYENLRNFDIKRFTEDKWGWPSKWWYFSEKLLNMIKADNIEYLRTKNSIDFIKNENNIFSDEILSRWILWWNTHKPEIHKNYLLSISNIFNEMSLLDIPSRKKFIIEKIEKAKETYKVLENNWVLLLDESADYHLSNWLQFIKSIE